MFPVYLASLGFGSVLIGVSLFFGGADKDFDKDFDVDHDADLDLEADVDHDLDLDGDVEVDAEVDLDAEVESIDVGEAVDAELQGFSQDTSLADIIWIPIFSMRFWTFGSAAFGFTGTALTLGSLSWVVTLVLALLFGTGTGTTAAYFFRALKKDQVTGTTTMRGYTGEEARVVLPIAPGGRGKIMVETPTGHLELLASTKDLVEIPVGATVLIAGIRNGEADVSALSDLTDEVSRRKRLTAKNTA